MEEKFDSILTILENPTRREIIKRLSQEPNYPLQLAKDLGLGQQLVAKHLKIMEEAGVVKSSSESSPHGPNRKTYILSKSLSVTLDVAPHFFKAKVVTFNVKPKKEDAPEDSAQFMERMDATLGHSKEHSRINPFKSLVFDIDKKLERLENERSVLLYIRNRAMKEASHIIGKFENLDTRRILHHTFDEQDISIRSISESLNLRESVVHQVMLKLKKDLNFGVERIERKTRT